MRFILCSPNSLFYLLQAVFFQSILYIVALTIHLFNFFTCCSQKINFLFFPLSPKSVRICRIPTDNKRQFTGNLHKNFVCSPLIHIIHIFIVNNSLIFIHTSSCPVYAKNQLYTKLSTLSTFRSSPQGSDRGFPRPRPQFVHLS